MNDIPKMGRMYDLTGMRFGRIVGLKPVGNARGGGAVWLFRCDCGTEFEAIGSNVIAGYTRSCGCLRRERSRERLLEIKKRRLVKCAINAG